jgi:hypothetical protein
MYAQPQHLLLLLTGLMNYQQACLLLKQECRS